LWSLGWFVFLIGTPEPEAALNGPSTPIDGSGDNPAGLPTDEEKMKSSRFIVSWAGGGGGGCWCGSSSWACWSAERRSCWAMPLGAVRIGGLWLASDCEAKSLLWGPGPDLCTQQSGSASSQGNVRNCGAVSGLGTWRLSYPLLRCSSARRMLRAIMRQVRLDMRSAFGSCVFAREYSFQIWVPRGSFFCSSVGDSGLVGLASLPKAGKMGSSSMPSGDSAGLPSRRMSKSMAAVVVGRGLSSAQQGSAGLSSTKEAGLRAAMMSSLGRRVLYVAGRTPRSGLWPGMGLGAGHLLCHLRPATCNLRPATAAVLLRLQRGAGKRRRGLRAGVRAGSG